MPSNFSTNKSVLSGHISFNRTPDSFARISASKKEVGDKNSQKKLFSAEQSQTIMNRIRHLRIKKLFEQIDFEKKGYINTDCILNFQGEPHIVRILKPVFEEIILQDAEFTLSEFEDNINVLLMKIPTNERILLLDVNNSKN